MPRTRATDALLLFDGDCGFCSTSVSWLSRHLPAMPPAEPYQWADLDAHGLSVDEAQSRAWLLTPGRHYGGERAIAELLKRQPSFGWRLLGRLLGTPPLSWLSPVGYRLVSRYRRHLPGGTPACRMPRG